MFRPALRYGFGELLDELAFWLALGLLLAGALSVVLPADLAARGWGSGIWPMLAMLMVGIPLYVCASASTPIAAALMAKGLSPGASLVFLLAGPATNAAALVLLTRAFGRRFVVIYVASVAGGALVAGLVLDGLILAFGWTISLPVVEASAEQVDVFGVSCAALLLLLLGWSLARGSLRSGWAELVASLRGLRGLLGFERWSRRRLGGWLVVLAAIAWFGSGFHSIPLGSQGFSFLWGRLEPRGIGPGLVWTWPAPIGRVEVRQVAYARKTDIGFRTDLGLVERRGELTGAADPEAWHSTVAAMNPDPEQASFLTADENLLEMSFSVHFRARDPVDFFFSTDHQHDFVELFAESVARELLASRTFENLMTVGRPELERDLAGLLQERLDGLAVGLEVKAVSIVDVHPPGESVFDFRDVSSAGEDKETRMDQARQAEAEALPRARGEAARLLARAAASADAAVALAGGRSSSFEDHARVIARNRNLLEFELWMAMQERILPGREKYLLPPGAGGGEELSLWRLQP